MAMGILGVLSIAAASAVFYAGQNAKSVERSNADTRAYSLAESGVAEAVSKLNEKDDPTTGTITGTRTTSVGTVRYSGAVQADGESHIWTIRSRSEVTNPSGPNTAAITREAVQRVRVTARSVTADPSLWDRFFHDRSDKCFTIDTVQIPASVTARGDLCLEKQGQIINNTTATGTTTVRVGDDVFLNHGNSSIGRPGNNKAVPAVAIGDRCRFQPGNAFGAVDGNGANNNGGSNGVSGAVTQTSPNCDSTTRIYANTITNDRTQLLKPQIDFAYWYRNADLGPYSDCSVGSFPGSFDDGARVRDGVGATASEITPTNFSYSCVKNDANGEQVAELSWDHRTDILTIQGTIFIDGDVRFDDEGQRVNYVGRGVIFAGDDVEFDEQVCAGTDDRGRLRRCDRDPSDWDPNTNLLTVISDGWSEYDQGLDLKFPGVYQGIVYAKDFCLIHQDFRVSGPVICDEVRLEENDEDQGGGWPSVYSWPALEVELPRALTYVQNGETTLEIELLEQTG